MEHLPLTGKVAIVTGAGSPIGLGHAMTIAMVGAGARVAMLDVNEKWLDETARVVRGIYGEECVLTQTCDISDPESAEESVRRTISRLGGLHILVNNAGVMRDSQSQEYTRSNFWDIAPATWSSVMAVNANGPFHMARASVGHMIEQKWGRIIGITTSVDSMYRQGMCPYGPSKASHEALAALMARELEGSGVTSNVLIPGGTAETNMVPRNLIHGKDGLIQPEVMKTPVVWLASEESQSINGQRFIANLWDDTLPIAKRLERSGAPAAWPQLGIQSVNPWS